MSNSEYVETIFNLVNSFRSKPSSFEKTFNTISKALKRAKREDVGQELESYSKTLPKNQLNDLILSSGLSKAAEDNLLNIIKNSGKLGIPTENKIKDRVNMFTTSSDNLLESCDQGDLDSLIPRLFISEFDPNRRIREALVSTNYKFIGIASADYMEDPITVIILATDVVEEVEVDYGDDSELKEAFDLFDIFHTGKLDEKALKEAFEALGFDKSSYSIYKSIIKMNGNNKVKKQGGVDWETFRDTIKELVGDLESKEGLRKLFELFVDDPKEDKISAETIRRVANELHDDITYNEIVNVLKRSSQNGVDIDFIEFCKIMDDYKELHTATS